MRGREGERYRERRKDGRGEVKGGGYYTMSGGYTIKKVSEYIIGEIISLKE